jgi:hypothetical protein
MSIFGLKGKDMLAWKLSFGFGGVRTLLMGHMGSVLEDGRNQGDNLDPVNGIPRFQQPEKTYQAREKHIL